MKEYGGYIELDTYKLPMLHEKAIALNCGRSALAYLCEAKNIKKLYLPYYICSSVIDICKKNGVIVEYYHIDEGFMPKFEKKIGQWEYLYIVNYYGQLSDDDISALQLKYKNIIVDQAQSYFQMPVQEVDTIYTCRKFFGVPDGAFLYTDTVIKRDLLVDESYKRMGFLLGRYERSANEFYEEYVANNKLFAEEPIKKMSKLTFNLLHGIDYMSVSQKREENFSYLNERIGEKNNLKLKVPKGAFAYPLLLSNGKEIREELQKKKIYIPTLWPNVLEECEKDMIEYNFAANILPVPVDQRYDISDMEYMVREIERCIV